MLIKTGSSKKCYEKNFRECKKSYVCKNIRDNGENKCIVNPVWYYGFEEKISKISLFLMIFNHFISNKFKNKLEYFISENIRNNKFLSVSHQSC